MARFIVRRLISMVLVLFADLGAHLPDLQRDPERRPGGAHRRAQLDAETAIQAIREEWGFDKPALRPVRRRR